MVMRPKKSFGKDTPSGHWEMMGLPVEFDWGMFPKDPPSFPAALLEAFIEDANLPGVLGNRHASGTVIIEELGLEHIDSGKPIVYTSADSVFQIAAHETHFGLDRLYEICLIARKLVDDYNVGRVIARPFVGEKPGEFQRTGNRRDYATPPHEPTLLDIYKEQGKNVISIGKISDIFAGSGITRSVKAHGNDALIDAWLQEIDSPTEDAIIFANFVDFDTLYGHRRDVPGYAAALEAFDKRLPELNSRLRADDVVVLSADHGCDPTWPGSDHTREFIPVLAFGDSVTPGSIGRRDSFADIGQSLAAHLGLTPLSVGKSFLRVRWEKEPDMTQTNVMELGKRRANDDDAFVRNPGLPLNLDWVDEIRVNRSAVDRRIATLAGRRTVKKDWQAAWLLKAISLMDLTTLAGDDTDGRVRRLCAKALQPVRQDLLEALGADNLNLTVGAVCVYHAFIETAIDALRGSSVGVAAVSTAFPAGHAPFETRLAEIEASVAAGATEIDIVISRRHVLTANWRALYDEVKAFREACGPAHLKSIIATGELGSISKVGKAAMVSMMAGADFVKTSTGMEAVNATLPVSLVMMRAIRDYYQRTGNKVGFKPAGGISAAKTALQYLILLKEELGDEWLTPHLFRFGASRLLGDIERQLEHHATGRYSAANRHPMG